MFIASSLDGFIARDDGSFDWLFTDQDYGYKQFYDSVDTVIMGRKTYDIALRFDDNPYKEKMVYVFTRRTPTVLKNPNVEFISEAVSFTEISSIEWVRTFGLSEDLK